MALIHAAMDSLSDEVVDLLIGAAFLVAFVPFVYGVYRFARWRAHREQAGAPPDALDVVGSVVEGVASVGRQQKRIERFERGDGDLDEPRGPRGRR